jgi:acetate kinase
MGRWPTIDHRTALHFVITWLEANLADTKVVAAGHRIVLGGTRFEAPALIEGEVLDYLDSLAAMEPSHQPFNVRRRPGLRRRLPGSAAGRLFRHLVPSHDAGGGADLRAAQGRA